MVDEIDEEIYCFEEMTTMKWHQKLRKMCHAFCGWRDSDAIDYNADDPEDEDVTKCRIQLFIR